MTDPLVSIVTITLNGEKTIRETIESVLSQDYSNFEYLIVDGGSTDSTLKIAESYKDPRIKILVGKDQGIADAMNRGIANCQGEIIGLIHSDDMYYPGAIRKSVEAIQKSGRSWSFGMLDFQNENGDFVCRVGRDFDLKRQKKLMATPHPTMFCKKSLYEKCGTFDLKYKYAMDYDLALRFALQTVPVYLPEPIARMSLGGFSSKNFKARLNANREVRKIQTTLLPGEEMFAWRVYLWNVLKISVGEGLKSLGANENFIRKFRRLVNPGFVKSPND